jgi:hypothetical protein
MSSRFERSRAACDRSEPTVSLLPQDAARCVDRRWQAIVRRFRRLTVSRHDDRRETASAPAKPTLRVLPGGRVEGSERRQRPPVIVRGRWHE